MNSRPYHILLITLAALAIATLACGPISLPGASPTSTLPVLPGSEGGGDFPMMADAADVTSNGTSLYYTTSSPVADVVAFYQAQLPMQGWFPYTSQDLDGVAILVYTRGDESMSVTITPRYGTTTVLIEY